MSFKTVKLSCLLSCVTEIPLSSLHLQSVQADVKPYLNEINGQYYISGKVSNLK